MSDELKYLANLVARGKMDRRSFLGRAAVLGASALASGLLTQTARAEGPVKGGTMRVGLGGGQTTDTLDPALAASEGPNTLMAQFGEKLLEVDAKGEIVPRLATEFGSSKDAKTWTFKIREGVTFHNGKSVTAEDVVETMKRHADSTSNSAALGLMAGITKMSASGNEFIAELKDPNADFPYIMADYHLLIQPEGGRANPADGIAAGPYKVVSQQPGVRYVFEKHADYWDDTRGHANPLDVTIINDDTARIAAVQSGQVDMINRVAPKVAELVASMKTVAVKSVPSRGHYVLVMRTNAKPFDNNDLRLALKYAIDRQSLLDRVLLGHGTLGNDVPINKFYPFFADDLEQRAYDPDTPPGSFYPYGGQPTAAEWLIAFLSANRASGTIASELRSRGLTLLVEPGRAALDQAGASLFQIGAVKKGKASTTLFLNGTSFNACETWFQSEFLCDPLILSEHAGDADDGREHRYYLAGHSCLGDDMISRRAFTSSRRLRVGDVLLFANTAGYQMDLLENNFHHHPFPNRSVLEPVSATANDLKARTAA